MLSLDSCIDLVVVSQTKERQRECVCHTHDLLGHDISIVYTFTHWFSISIIKFIRLHVGLVYIYITN